MLLASIARWRARTGGFRPRKAGLGPRSGPTRRFSQAVLGNGRSSDGGFLGKLFRRKRMVVFLLLLTVFLPLVHLAGWVPKLIPSKEFVDGRSNVNGGSEQGKLHGISHESSTALKGLLGLFNADDLNGSSEVLSLQTLGKEDEGITGSNELRKPRSEETIEMGYQQTPNTTYFNQQENRFQSISRQEFLRGNPGNYHMPDARIRQLRDLLAVAKVYLDAEPTQSDRQFIGELHERIREVESIIHETTADSTADSELPGAYEKRKAMEETLSKGKQIIDDCVATEKNLRSVLQSTEGHLHSEMKQTQFLSQLLAKTIPKGLHCLPLRLSVEYYSLNSTQQNQIPNQEKLEDNKLYHYALFSDNVLAAAVVVNSTLCHTKHPEDHVFHIVTDSLNYAAMKMWFLSNPPGKATVQVQKVEDFTWLNSSYSPVLKQLESESMINYYFKTQDAKSDGNLKYRNPKYLSILNHLRFYLPEIFPELNKVVFLDDDIVVQKDLTGLWGIDLMGKVNGAVETCGKSFHRFDKYLNFSNPLIAKNFDPHACGWAYGMNVFDLVEWRKQNITDVYHSWQNLNHDRQLWKLGSLPPGLITFYDRTMSLNRTWHVLGLGYDDKVDEKDIENAAVIHYNGNKKPWLDIGMAKYRRYWSKYVNYDQSYLRRCNIVP